MDEEKNTTDQIMKLKKVVDPHEPGFLENMTQETFDEWTVMMEIEKDSDEYKELRELIFGNRK